MEAIQTSATFSPDMEAVEKTKASNAMKRNGLFRLIVVDNLQKWKVLVKKRGIPYIQQEAPGGTTEKKRQHCQMYGVLTVMVLLVVTAAVCLSVYNRSLEKDRMCTSLYYLGNQTMAQCGRMLHLLSKSTGNENNSCSLMTSSVRCIHTTLSIRGTPCTVGHVQYTLSEFMQSEVPARYASPCPDSMAYQPTKSWTESRPTTEICVDGSALYRLARENCSDLLNPIEGNTSTPGRYCQKMILLEECIESSLHRRDITCRGNTGSLSHSSLILPPSWIEHCKDNGTVSYNGSTSATLPCLGALNSREMEAFVQCSSYLSLQSPTKLATVNCRLFSYMVRCVEQKLSKMGRSCSVGNIKRRILEDSHQSAEINLNRLDMCENITLPNTHGDICKEELILGMLAEDMCSGPGNQPFQITESIHPMSQLFKQCSEFSGLVTCVSEYLTSAEIPCHPGVVKNTLINSDAVTRRMGDMFNYNQCKGDLGERLCHDGQTLLLIAQGTCNIALDFLRKQSGDVFKCSYYREFVTCVQALLQPRGYECNFEDLQNAFVKVRAWFIRQTQFDPVICTS